jgi:hypothetical protein
LSRNNKLSINATAQYKPIANGQTIKWIVKNEVFDMAIIDTLFLADTIIKNAVTYQKVIYKAGRFDKNNHIAGYFREDTTLGKAWFWGYNDTAEYLIMDLSLNVGDSIYVKMAFADNAYAQVTNVEYLDGRKTLTTNYHFGGGFISKDLKFIEGVGPNATVMYQIDESTAFEIGQLFGYLVCKQYNNLELVYAWDTVNYECGRLFDNIYEKSKAQVTVFPNPVNDLLNIKLLKNTQSPVTIYNAFGGIVMYIALADNPTTINVSNFTPGLYYIKVGVNAGKFVKQ